MSSDVNFDRNVAGPAHGTDRTAWLDACGAACRRGVRRLSNWTEAGARYVRERRAAGIAADLESLARERPGQTLAVAAILGALAGGAIHGFGRRR